MITGCIQADVATERKTLKEESKTMDGIMNSTIKRITVRGLVLAACIISLAMQPFTASPAVAATTLPVLWTAGGLSAGTRQRGQRRPDRLRCLGQRCRGVGTVRWA